jgi:hypothetical protein
VVSRAVLVVAVLAACDSSASSQLGLDNLMQISGAQYVPGPFPQPSGGPATVQVVPTYGTAIVGSMCSNNPCTAADQEVINGLLDPGATAAVVGVQGVDGSWIVTAGFPGVTAPNNPTISPTIELADNFPIGPFNVLVASADIDNQVGPPMQATIIAAPLAPPSGLLVVSLLWNTAAELDLHVIDPNGSEVWSGSPNTIKPAPPGQPPLPPSAFADGGILDNTANLNCRHDGHPHEDVIWQAPPPHGMYTVRVDPISLCGDPIADWYVAAYAANGSAIAAARGVSTPDDVAYGMHGMGGGITALTFSQ